MDDRTKNIVVTIGFVAILICSLFASLLKNDEDISTTERRKLASFPKITWKKLINGEVTDNLEKYTTDQFILRDSFMNIKSLFSTYAFRQKDNNGLFLKENAIYKMEYPLKEENVNRSLDRIKAVYEKYMKGQNVYFAIIPDKNYYLENDDHLKFDYEKLRQISKGKLGVFNYIDIWNDLELKDYYRTDLHWKQENIEKIANKLKTSMKTKEIMKVEEISTNPKENIKEEGFSNYKKIDIGTYYGTYYGQLGLKIEPDKMYILTNDVIENCITYNYETKKTGKVYDKKATNDKYDIYLSGATPLITIENPKANSNKELLLFRDSFGSSIAPLLIQDYTKITLIDLRYISSNILSEYIEFKNQDVLFLYSTVVLNQNVLK